MMYNICYLKKSSIRRKFHLCTLVKKIFKKLNWLIKLNNKHWRTVCNRGKRIAGQGERDPGTECLFHHLLSLGKSGNLRESPV